VTAQREWFEKDYYAVLGVPQSSTQKDITKAYRKLARELHPDANPGNAAAEERFKEVAAAYDVLGDETKRAEYDEVRRLGPMAGGFGGGGDGGFGGGRFQDVRFDDLGDLGGLFGNLFGGRARTTTPRGGGPQRGADLETTLHLDFADAARGITTSVHLTSDAPCATCHGSGARPGTVPASCVRCGGSGFLHENQGSFSFASPCTACAGNGVTVTDPCGTCAGTGVERRPREVRVRIPPGVDDGQRIKLKGRGAPGRRGGPSGDLYVVVRVAAHPLFGRSGRDLTLTVPVTFAEAALGADVRVPTLEDGPVTVRIPAGTRSGRTLRVRNRGIRTDAGAGDLLVTVDVVVPSTLSPAEREAIEALAAVSSAAPRDHLGV
jgi:molecular chaperone DnaJ